MSPALTHTVTTLHEDLWRRFIDPRFGTVLDWAPLDGLPDLPTPEDCELARPNALAWWTPAENGAFFGGLYLAALCRRWQAQPDKTTAGRVAQVVDGLLTLAEIGTAPGFIARGVAADGRSHYAAGSDDQTFPWFYGLWCYLHSDLPDDARRERVQQRWRAVATALAQRGWRLPCDRPGFGDRGSFTEPHFVGATRLLFCLRATAELTGEQRWLDDYRRRRDEPLRGGLTRHGLLAAGVQFQPPGQPIKYFENPAFWTTISCVAALVALLAWEDDDAWHQGLRTTIQHARPHVARWRKFALPPDSEYDLDWRALNALWRPQRTIADAVAVAEAQSRIWHAKAGRRAEFGTLREALSAAWMLRLAGDRTLDDEIEAMLLGIPWTKLRSNLAFIGEGVAWGDVR